jgi:hypothetical protein
MIGKSAGLMAGSCGKVVFLLSRMSPPSSEGAQEPLPCAQLTLGIDPRRTDSRVGGRLGEGFAQQLGGRAERESGNKETIVCLTLPSREASYDPGAPRVPPHDKEGLL